MKILKFAATLGLGVISGLLFAKKSGKKFREELKSSKNPIKTLTDELRSVGVSIGVEFADWAKNSKNLQEILEKGGKEVEDFVESARKLGKEAKKITEDEWEKLAKKTRKKASDAKKAGENILKKAKNGVKKTKKIADL